jgi:hypothetical protein
MSSKHDIQELRGRRIKLIQGKERNRLREEHGAALVAALSSAVDYRLSLRDFEIDASPPFELSWLGRLEESPGLNAAYISKDDADKIAACIDTKLSLPSGRIGIYGNDYLGICRVDRVSIGGLVKAAEEANDAVVFYPEGISGAVLVDYYSSNPGFRFSVLAQGGALTDRLRTCFALSLTASIGSA